MTAILKNAKDVPTDFKKKFHKFETSYLDELIEKVKQENRDYFCQKAKEYYNSSCMPEERQLLMLQATMIIKEFNLKPSDYESWPRSAKVPINDSTCIKTDHTKTRAPEEGASVMPWTTGSIKDGPIPTRETSDFLANSFESRPI